MPGRFPNPEELVIDRWHGLDRSRGEPRCGEALVRRKEIIDHQVKRGIARDHLELRHKDQMRPPAQLEDDRIRRLMHGAHPERTHETGGFFQPICIEHDVPYPDRWPPIIIVQLSSPL